MLLDVGDLIVDTLCVLWVHIIRAGGHEVMAMASH
jgi:hypothetical protein